MKVLNVVHAQHEPIDLELVFGWNSHSRDCAPPATIAAVATHCEGPPGSSAESLRGGRDNGHVTNRLANATSPYLLQHKDNPVDWWPWCDEAFAQAKRRDVPVFLSVGYAACHWCHVMAHESFEDPATAAVLNRDFVSIKVDREERPDVDAVYGCASGAHWPWRLADVGISITTSSRFMRAMYYPLRSPQWDAIFKQVLVAVSDAWVTRRPEMDEGAQKIAEALAAGQLVRDVGPAQGAITPRASTKR